MLVYKFGGTSVGSAERMIQVASLVKGGESKIVVLSAVSGTTNSLVGICDAYYAGDKTLVTSLVEEFRPKYDKHIYELLQNENSIAEANELMEEKYTLLKSYDVASFSGVQEREIHAQGELISTKLMHLYLTEQGLNAALIPALDFMRTENGEPMYDEIENRIKEVLATYPATDLFITQGYICTNEFGQVDNLQRGGSDYTASIIGACIEAKEVQIWTDIDGMHNNDPRFVEGTKAVERLTYDEAAELAYFGAKILHPLAVLPAQKKDIPVRLKNTMQPEAFGTLIGPTSDESIPVKSVAAKNGIVAIKIRSSRMLMAYGFLKNVFEVFETYKTPIDMITTSEVAVSLTIDNDENLEAIVKDLEAFGCVEVDTEQTIVCVVGQLLVEDSKVVSSVVDALESLPIRMISYGGSKSNISVLIPTQYKNQALNLLHQELYTKELV
ncbi:aspartate kinase [Flammeovirga kamogawensis]|uniref:Aspartokinase n=1 Tax=Flammeovirga kamogawensis TaxID=373891 RepID=A0ABX8GX07_9BACT|nr:aspartate kinase [Flammeovirga kamogawensis]MBB6460786.1 aspartate kinase [Flammeovirga kamogawensis]QWG08139.1 aspartate kinase [Flammeovirga kamogawensis]TRX69942.1 aspartate kinase [Flammeovirga kamogawensis]